MRFGNFVILALFSFYLTEIKGEQPLESILVSASRNPISISKSTSSVTILDNLQIEARQAIYVSDLLRLTPGVSISSSGGRGKTTQVRMRGAEGNHVMVLVDGVEVNDPAIGDEFDLATFTTSNVERIEIIRGPQSALWGSDAVAGVINIITKKAREGMNADLILENGSHGTEHQNFSASIGKENYGIFLAANHIESGGTNISRFGAEDDGFEIFSMNLRCSAILSRGLSAKISARYEDSQSETDSGFPLITDFPNENKTRKSSVASTLRSSLFDDRLRNEINMNWTSANNNNVDKNNNSLDKTSSDKYELTYQTTVSFDSNYVLPTTHQMTFAIDHEHQRFRQRGQDQGFGNPNQNRHINNTGFIGEYLGTLGSSLVLSAAIRSDINSDYSNGTTFKVGGSYDLPFTNTKVRLNYSTAQKNPTFIERFGFFVPDSSATRFEGNPNLKPEKATGWELGLERNFWTDQLVFSVAWFREKLENEINGFIAQPDDIFTALNVGGTSLREGLETSITAVFPMGLSVKTNYTYLDATELNAVLGRRVDEVRRPNHQMSLQADWHSDNGKLALTTFVTHSGAFFDLDFSQFPATRERLKSYTLVGFNGRYNIRDYLKGFIKVENAFDEHYEDIIGFKTPGLSAYIGIKLSYSN